MGASATVPSAALLCSQNQAVSVSHKNNNNNNNNNNLSTNSHHTNNAHHHHSNIANNDNNIAATAIGGHSTTTSTTNPISTPLTPNAHHDDHLNLLENNRNLWLSTSSFLTADAIAAASIQEKAYLSQFPSPTITSAAASSSAVAAAHQAAAEKKMYASCRYPQEKLDYFSKYTNMTTETATSGGGGGCSGRQSTSTAAQYASDHNGSGSAAAAAAAAAASLYGAHFSPVGYHLPLPTYEAATARTCALPSPTIYPPTPPPSAPWIHPWFVGDTF